MNTNHVGYIRTYVPIIVGFGATWLAENANLFIDADTKGHIVAIVGAAATGLYYTAARFLEARFPAAGRLLGVAKQPVYPSTT